MFLSLLLSLSLHLITFLLYLLIYFISIVNKVLIGYSFNNIDSISLTSLPIIVSMLHNE